LGNIIDLAIKAFEGKLRRQGLTNPTCADGERTTTGLLTSITALAGKNLFLAKAKVTFYADSADPALGDKVELRFNGTKVETSAATLQVAFGSNGFATWTYKFENLNHFVGPTDVISLEVTVLDPQTTVTGSLEGWDEDTADSPQIPPLNPV